MKIKVNKKSKWERRKRKAKSKGSVSQKVLQKKFTVIQYYGKFKREENKI